MFHFMLHSFLFICLIFFIFSIVHSFLNIFRCYVVLNMQVFEMRYVQTGRVVSTQTPAFFHMSLSPCYRFSIVLKACAGCHLEGSWTYACISSVLFFPTCQVRAPRWKMILSEVHPVLLLLLLLLILQLLSRKPQTAVGASTASEGSQWALPDLNRERRISVGHCRTSTASTRAAGPQPRVPDLNVRENARIDARDNVRIDARKDAR